MNRHERPSMRHEATLEYGHSEYRVIRSGEFVRCAITGDPIALAELRYWNVARQEPYRDAKIALQRYRELHDTAPKGTADDDGNA